MSLRIVGDALVSFGANVGAAGPAVGGSTRRWSTRDGVWLALRDELGATGWGESAPLPGLSRETLQDCREVLSGVSSRLAVVPLGEDVTARDALTEAMASVEGELRQLASARFALETALLDLVAQRRGVPLANVLSGSPHPSVARSGLLSLRSDRGAMLADAKAQIARGVSALKVKIGAPGRFDDEIDALQALRGALGPYLALRLDANGAWSVEQARSNLGRLVDVAPEYVEQPVPAGQLLSLGECAVPWAADESLLIADEADQLLQTSACAVFVIKPALLGVFVALDLAVRAQHARKEVAITHAFDGPIGMAAACELARSLPARPLPCGLDEHAVLRAIARCPAVPQLVSGSVVAGGVGHGVRPVPEREVWGDVPI